MQQKKKIQVMTQKTLIKKVPFRIVIYAKDIENIMGCKPRTAYRVLENIRKILGKQKHQFITFWEFCEFTGLDKEVVVDFLLV